MGWKILIRYKRSFFPFFSEQISDRHRFHFIDIHFLIGADIPDALNPGRSKSDVDDRSARLLEEKRSPLKPDSSGKHRILSRFNIRVFGLEIIEILQITDYLLT